MAEQDSIDVFMRRLTEVQSDFLRYVSAALPVFPDDVNDVVQDINYLLIQHAREYRPERPFLPWAITYAKNQIRVYCRNKKREKLVFDNDLLDLCEKSAFSEEREPDAHSQEMKQLALCLDRLQEGSRRLVDLHYLKGCPMSEIAREEHKPESTIRMTIFRARKALAECIKRLCRLDRSQENPEAPLSGFEDSISHVIDLKDSAVLDRFLASLHNNPPGMSTYTEQVKVHLLLVERSRLLNVRKKVRERLANDMGALWRRRLLLRCAAAGIALILGSALLARHISQKSFPRSDEAAQAAGIRFPVDAATRHPEAEQDFAGGKATRTAKRSTTAWTEVSPDKVAQSSSYELAEQAQDTKGQDMNNTHRTSVENSSIPIPALKKGSLEAGTKVSVSSSPGSVLRAIAAATALTLAGPAPANETIGLWLFKEASSGVQVTNTYNAVDAAKYKGTPIQDADTKYPLYYSAEAPGRYVYLNGNNRVPSYENPQSVYLQKEYPAQLSSKSTLLKIDSIAGFLSTNQSYTVEFFFKQDVSAGWSQYQTIAYMGTEGRWKVDISGSSSLSLQGRHGTAWWGGGQSISSATLTSAWHHVAMVYAASNNTGRLYLDYVTSGTPIVLTNGTAYLDDLTFGSSFSTSDSETWNGWIACPRVSLGTLQPEDFLRVNNRTEEDKNALGVWLFTDGAAGTVVSKTENALDTFEYIGSVSKGASGTNDLLFSGEKPGKYLYRDSSGTNLLSSTYQSIYARKDDPTVCCASAMLNLAKVGNKLSTQEAYTVECFFKQDVSKGFSRWQTVFSLAIPDNVKLNVDDESTVRIENSTHLSYVPSRCNATSGWHHAAMVYTASNHIAKLYVDYTASSADLKLTNSLVTGSSHLRFLSAAGGPAEGWNGWVAAPRVTLAALTPENFLHATDRVPGDITLGLWPFTDGAAGTVVSKTENALDTVEYIGSISKGTSGTNDLLFSDEKPGKYLYSDSSATNLLSSTYQSIYARKDDPTVCCASAMLNLSKVGNKLSTQEAYTVECFFKQDVSKGFSRWQTVFSFAIPDYVKLNVDDESTVRIENSTHFSYVPSRCDATSGWHHAAMVYTASNHIAKLYVDYTASSADLKLTNSLVTGSCHLRFLSAANGPAEGWNGWVAAPRVTLAALTPEKFLHISQGGGKKTSTVFYWRFEEGTNGIALKNAENSATNGIYLETKGRGTCSQPEYGGVNPAYSSVWGNKGKVLDGDTLIGYNTKAAYFAGATDVDGDAAKVGGRLTTAICYDWSVLDSFTLEAIVKMKQGAVSGTSLIMGNGITGSPYYNWRLAAGADGAWYASAYGTDGVAITLNVPSAKTLGDHRWHHVAVTYDKSSLTFRVYVDYVLGATTTLTAPLSKTPGWYDFGYGCGVYGFTGWMDEIRLSDTVLEPSAFIHYTKQRGFVVMLM